jgi:hypothetical protein
MPIVARRAKLVPNKPATACVAPRKRPRPPPPDAASKASKRLSTCSRRAPPRRTPVLRLLASAPPNSLRIGGSASIALQPRSFWNRTGSEHLDELPRDERRRTDPTITSEGAAPTFAPMPCVKAHAPIGSGQPLRGLPHDSWAWQRRTLRFMAINGNRQAPARIVCIPPPALAGCWPARGSKGCRSAARSPMPSCLRREQRRARCTALHRSQQEGHRRHGTPPDEHTVWAA